MNITMERGIDKDVSVIDYTRYKSKIEIEINDIEGLGYSQEIADRICLDKLNEVIESLTVFRDNVLKGDHAHEGN